MDYEKIETDRYESMWQEVAARLSDKPKNYKRNPNPSPSVRKFFDLVSSTKKEGSFLDVGCGNGRHAIYFAKKGFESFGIDVSKSAIEFSRTHAKIQGVKANFEVGSVFRLPYNKDSFDVVLDSGCLHHLRKSEWKSYLNNILTVLKKDGYYFLSCFSTKTPHIPRFSPKKGSKRNWTLRNMHYNHFFTDKEVIRFFSKHFKVLDRKDIQRKNSKLRFKVFFMQKL